jgi:hypothetical protein
VFMKVTTQELAGRMTELIVSFLLKMYIFLFFKSCIHQPKVKVMKTGLGIAPVIVHISLVHFSHAS